MLINGFFNPNVREKNSMVNENTTHPDLAWSGVWYGFLAHFFNEQGLAQIRPALQNSIASNNPADMLQMLERAHAFLDKLDALSKIPGIADTYTRIVTSRGRPDPNDIQSVGESFAELEKVSPFATQMLKSAIREFLKSILE